MDENLLLSSKDNADVIQISPKNFEKNEKCGKAVFLYFSRSKTKFSLNDQSDDVYAAVPGPKNFQGYVFF